MEGSEVVIFRLCQSKVEALDLRGNLHLGYSLWSQHQGRQFKTFETKLQQELKKKKNWDVALIGSAFMIYSKTPFDN